MDGISLTVRSGEIFGLLGPNGSGKTTIINMISGLSKPSSGEAKVLGYNIIHDTRVVYAALGSVPQETAVLKNSMPGQICLSIRRCMVCIGLSVIGR